MRKRWLALAALVPAVIVAFVILATPHEGVGGDAKTAPEDGRSNGNNSFMDVYVTGRPNPRGLDFVVKVGTWHAPQMRADPLDRPAVLKVRGFAAGDEEGRGEPAFWFQSDPFTAVRGKRLVVEYPFQIPAAGGKGRYLVRAAIEGVNPTRIRRGDVRTVVPDVMSLTHALLRVQ